MNKQRGRPKGRSSKNHRSYGPLGDLIRQKRLALGLGLAEVARSCQCSVQFISNMEHGRAPLPWDKLPSMAEALGLQLSDLQAANLAVRSDFQTFVSSTAAPNGNSVRGKRVEKPKFLEAALAASVRDRQLSSVIQAYQAAPEAARRRFVKSALELLSAN